MEWVIGAYIVVGVFKTLGMLGSNIGQQPQWVQKSTGLNWLACAMGYVLFWPFHPRRR